MSMIQALLLGLVQGITSMLPVSSSGHLVLLSHLMGINGDISLKFLTLLHLGTLFGVISFFYGDIIRLLMESVGMLLDAIHNLVVLLRNIRHPEQGKYNTILGSNYRKFAWMLLVSMVPTMLVGMIIRRISETAVNNLLLTAMGFFITGLLLAVSSFTVSRNRKPSNTRYRDALVIGTLQGLSGFPGISRLGMCMSGTTMAGFGRKYAVEYSMLLSIPTILGGIIAEAGQQSADILQKVGAGQCVIGIFGAAAAAYFMVRITARSLSGTQNRGFAAYCVVIGILTIVAYM